MTIIAGRVIENIVELSGERAYSQDSLIMISKEPKIIQITPFFILGVAGDGALGQSILYYDWSDTSYKDIRTICKTFTKIVGDSEEVCEVLLGYYDRLFSWDRGVLLEHDYFAIGDGAQVGLGVLWMGGSPIRAVQAACDHIASCAGPVDNLHT